MRIVETMPVPIVTLNQLGEKLRTIRRQPRSDLDKSVALVSTSRTFPCSPDGSDIATVLLLAER